MKKIILVISVLLVITLGVYLLIKSNNNSSSDQPDTNPEVKSAQTTNSETGDYLVREDSFFVGTRDAQVVIVEFSDFECPACQYYSKEIEQVISNYPNDVKVIFRNFPLSYHENAMPSALAAESAGIQGKYYEMYQLLFAEQKLSEQDFVAYAKQLDLDMDKFNSDRNSQEVLDKINRDYQDGLTVGIQGTPTFYLNGQEMKANPVFTNWKTEIDKLLK